MPRIRTVSDFADCRALWQSVIPKEFVSDLWEVRHCFWRHYRHQLCFVVAETNGVVCGLLPLVHNEDTDSFLYFPGETWHGKTWLEQNRLVVPDADVLDMMLAAVPGKYHLRYLLPAAPEGWSEDRLDEIGYFFLPPRFDYELENYFGQFSGKSAKRLRRELQSWEAHRVELINGDPSYFETLVKMNLDRYGEDSYFHDARFLESFRSLFQFLSEQGWLRLTAVLVDGVPAAVDMGCVYNGTYTLLAGGTEAQFPGIAKLINIHHMRWACEQRLQRVDFLCGDFNWKTLFHLAPRPLYVLTGENPLDRARTAGEATVWCPPMRERQAGLSSHA